MGESFRKNLCFKNGNYTAEEPRLLSLNFTASLMRSERWLIL